MDPLLRGLCEEHIDEKILESDFNEIMIHLWSIHKIADHRKTEYGDLHFLVFCHKKPPFRNFCPLYNGKKD